MFYRQAPGRLALQPFSGSCAHQFATMHVAGIALASGCRHRFATPLLVLGLLLSVAVFPGAAAADKPKILTAADAVSGAISVPDTHGAPVTVNGDGHLPVRLWSFSWWNHDFVANKDGSITLTEGHASGQKTTLKNVPAVYFVDGAGVSLPSLKPIDPSAPVQAQSVSAPANPMPVAGKSGGGDGPGILHAPVLPKPVAQGEIVAVAIRNDTSKDLPSRIVTFGQAFLAGDFPDGSVLEAKTPSGTIPVQVDVKLRYRDKSVKYAVLSLQTPALAHGASVAAMLSTQGKSAATAAISPEWILSKGYDLAVIRDPIAESGLPRVAVDVKALLAAGAANGSLTTWLHGPLVSEYRVSQQVAPNLLITVDIRAGIDGTIATDVTVANDFAYLNPKTSTYGVSVTATGMPTWQSAPLTQHKFQEWHRLFWNRETVLPSVVLDVDYLERTGAVPNFDLSSGVARTVIETSLKAVANGPLGSGLITQKMGSTGGRDDIGPTTNWAANYLVSQDAESKAIMLAQADAAASIPWHVREADGRMITAAAHPRLWLDDRCKTVDCIPGGFRDLGTGWELDSAHEPDLAYVPYLVTGSHFYLDQLQSEANWVVLSQDPLYRKDAQGLFYPASQVRGTAWNIRDVANAAWITPDGDPLKTYFENVLKNNIDGLTQIYLTDRSLRQTGAIEGFIENPYDKMNVGPWQQDFLSLVMSQQALRGLGSAKAFLGWMENFTAGRFLHASDGFDPRRGPAYYLDYVDPQTHVPTNTWAGLYQLNFGDKPVATGLDGTPSSSGDYAAVARAALANLFSSTEHPRALKAFAFLVINTPGMPKAFANGNAYNINPRLSDGHVLQNDEIQYASTADTVLAAKGAHSMLIAGDRALTLQAKPGVSILVGGAGASKLVGARGVNYFFGGSGDNAAVGAPGRNYFYLGTGRMQIDLAAGDTATDQIAGFRPGRDHIHLAGADGAIGKLIDGVQKSEAGSMVLTIAPDHKIEFIGLSSGDIQPGIFN